MLKIYFTFRLIIWCQNICVLSEKLLLGEKKHDWQATWSFFPLPHSLFKVCHGQMNDIFGKQNGVNHGNRQEDHCRETSLCGLFRFYFTQLFNYTRSHKKWHGTFVCRVTRAAPARPRPNEEDESPAQAHARQTPRLSVWLSVAAVYLWEVDLANTFPRCAAQCLVPVHTGLKPRVKSKYQNFRELWA